MTPYLLKRTRRRTDKQSGTASSISKTFAANETIPHKEKEKLHEVVLSVRTRTTGRSIGGVLNTAKLNGIGLTTNHSMRVSTTNYG